MNKKVTLDYILFMEEGLYVIYAPQIGQCHNGRDKKEALESLSTCANGLFDYYRERKVLIEYLKKLGLWEPISERERYVLNIQINVPYYILKTEHELGQLEVELACNISFEGNLN